MVYIAGQPHHRLKDADIVDHLVELVEKKAAEIESARKDGRGSRPSATPACRASVRCDHASSHLSTAGFRQ